MKSTILISRIMRVIETEGAVGEGASLAEDYSAAVSCYRQAVKIADNDFAAGYLRKLGGVYEHLGDKAAALGCYKTLKEKYPASVEAYDIDQFIAAVEE